MLTLQNPPSDGREADQSKCYIIYPSNILHNKYINRKNEIASATTSTSDHPPASPSPSALADDPNDIFADGRPDSLISIDEIYVTIGDMQDLLAEWTDTWGPITSQWKHFEARLETAQRNNTANRLKSEFITFVQQARRRTGQFHIDRLALVDLDGVDLEEVREGWTDALRVTKELLTRLAIADGIISIRLEEL
jgi:hypothetical protein